VVCDESVSALDVSIQAEIVNLLKDLQDEMGVAFLFIAHDLSRGGADQPPGGGDVCRPGFVEYAARALFFRPRHPYTHALLSAVPVVDPDADVPADPPAGRDPQPAGAAAGCRFHTRCPFARDRCAPRCPPGARSRPSTASPATRVRTH
jgi:peptide/nickel transport system ATP-binding protein